MPNYLEVLANCFPGAEAYTGGDPSVYGDIIWVTTPIDQATLDASECAQGNVPTTDPIFAEIPPGGIPDGSQLVWDAVNQVWTIQQLGLSGKVIQVVYGDISPQSGTTEIPIDDTVPLITEGTLLGAAPVTIHGSGNIVHISFTLAVATSKNEEQVIISLFRDNTCIGTFPISSVKEHSTTTHTFTTIDSPGSPGTYTYSGRIGVSRGTWYVNQIYTSYSHWNPVTADLGGTISSKFAVMEIQPQE